MDRLGTFCHGTYPSIPQDRPIMPDFPASVKSQTIALLRYP
jgi:hypothetical protein